MKYRDRLTGDLKSKDVLLKENYNISLPKEWNDNTYNILNVDPVFPTKRPIIDDVTKIVKYSGELRAEDGKYYQKWEIVNRFNQYVNSDGNIVTVEKQNEDYIAQLKEEKEQENRELRNSLLLDTDWWAKTDNNLTESRASYRQALRDITNHSDWPNLQDEDWPENPDNIENNISTAPDASIIGEG